MPLDDDFAYPGLPQAAVVSTRALIPTNAADFGVALGNVCSTITIAVEAGNSDLHFSPANTTATTSNFKIPAGTSYTYQGPPISAFRLISNNAAPTNYYNVMAY